MMKTNIKKTVCSGLLLVGLGLLGKPTPAQDASHGPILVAEETSEVALKAAPAKSHKIWTEDDVASLRTPADQYAEEKAAQEEAAAEAETSTTAKPTGQPVSRPSHKPLVDPKNPEEADDMIAWENRDIDAQTDYIRQMQEKAASTTGAEREHYLAEKARMEGVLAQTQKELKILKAQKAELEKPKPEQNE